MLYPSPDPGDPLTALRLQEAALTTQIEQCSRDDLPALSRLYREQAALYRQMLVLLG